MQTVREHAPRPSRRGTQREPEAPARYDGFDKIVIDGEWRAGRSGKSECDRDPYSGETLVEIALADASDVDDAYRAASAAQPDWAAALPQERRDVLERAALIVEARKEELLDWLVKESGSTRVKAELEWQFMHLGLLEAASYPFLHPRARSASRLVTAARRCHGPNP